MKIVTRLKRLFLADIHGVMDQLEDKELLIKQFLREMRQSLLEKKVQLQHLKIRIHTHENHAKADIHEIEKLEKDITLALKKDKENIARMLIRKKFVHEHQMTKRNEQKRELVYREKDLSTLVAEQSRQYESLKAKAAIYQHRPKQCQLSTTEPLFSNIENDQFIREEEVELELLSRKNLLTMKGDSQ